MKGSIQSILHETKPYDFLLLIVSAIVGLVFSYIGDSKITSICSTVIIILFILFWAIYNIRENNADYLRMINREFKNGHWYEVLYLAFPICATLRRLGKYRQSVRVAEKILEVLNKVNAQKIDADCMKKEYTNIEKLREKLMINDLGYAFFLLKNMEKAKQYIRTGIEIAKENKISYAELKGWSILLQMTLIDNYEKFITKEFEEEIYENFQNQFKHHFDCSNNQFPKPNIQGYISYLKSFEVDVRYRYQHLEKMDKGEFLSAMKKLAEAYAQKNLCDKYYDCMKCVFEIQLSDSQFDSSGNAVTLLTNNLDGAFDANVGLTPVQYIKYVTLYLEYYIRTQSAKDKPREEKKAEAFKVAIKEDRERIRKYIKKIEKELWYVEDPCIKRFKEMKQKYKIFLKKEKEFKFYP